MVNDSEWEIRETSSNFYPIRYCHFLTNTSYDQKLLGLVLHKENKNVYQFVI